MRMSRHQRQKPQAPGLFSPKCMRKESATPINASRVCRSRKGIPALAFLLECTRRGDNSFGPSGFGSTALAMKRVERRLAAILAADVAGCSRAMGEDEAALPDRPSIVVRSFVNMSRDPEQGYFARALPVGPALGGRRGDVSQIPVSPHPSPRCRGLLAADGSG
jgi:hypothetical protein